MDIQAQREEFKAHGRFLIASPYSPIRDWDNFVEEARVGAEDLAWGREVSPQDWVHSACDLVYEARCEARHDADRRRKGYYVFHGEADQDETAAEAAAACP